MLGKTASWIGQVLVGRYEVTAMVGSGGMAVLYRARDRNLGCDVAVKVPDAILLRDPTFAARFDREIRALVQLTHPHIVKISDVGVHDGLPFAVLQYLKGGSLRTRMRSGHDGQPVPMRPEELRGWLGNAAAALDFIHKRGFVHRDIKPDNILFDDAGQVYIGDFGIAKVVYEQGKKKFGSSLSLTGPTPGTPPYMAPELILGETYDGRADQFALAITVYELFVGGVPFDGATPTAIREQQKAAAAPLDVLRRSAPAGVAAAVQQALSYEPARRHKDCTAFARAVLKSVVSAGNRAQVPVALPAAVAKETPAVAGTVLQWISVSCPGCRTTERVKATAQGTEINCSSCGRKILVPSAAQAAATQKQSVGAATIPKRRPIPKSVSTPVAEKRGAGKMLLVGGSLLVMLLAGLVVGWQTIGEGKMPGWFKSEAKKDGLLTKSSDKGATKPKIDSEDQSSVKEQKGPVLAKTEELNLGAGVMLKLVRVDSGKFLMGSPPDEVGREPQDNGSEFQHEVVITKPFYMGVYAVTQRQYRQVTTKNPSNFSAEGKYRDKVVGLITEEFPVENVSWYDAMEFCRKLAVKLDLNGHGRKIDLPTEAEWEYACRAGSKTAYHFGNLLSVEQANFSLPGETTDPRFLGGRTAKAGSYEPNAWGLYDMHGNVWQWCGDWYGKNYYTMSPNIDPLGPSDGLTRVARGGCAAVIVRHCRAASRVHWEPGYCGSNVGFRVVLRLVGEN